MFDSITCDSPRIQSLARQAAARCQGRMDQDDAIAAVILSFSAFEAFLNELAQLVEFVLDEVDRDEDGPYAHYPESLVTMLRPLAWALRISIRYKARTVDRYDIVWEAFSGKPIVKGDGVRQRLAVLNSLRNDIVHIKSERPPIIQEGSPSIVRYRQDFSTPKYFDSLRAYGLLSEDMNELHWLRRVCSRKVADWSCETVERAAGNLVALLPRGDFRDKMEEDSLRPWPARDAD